MLKVHVHPLRIFSALNYLLLSCRIHLTLGHCNSYTAH